VELKRFYIFVAVFEKKDLFRGKAYW